MKLQIVLIAACLLPLFSLAKEETMVERRQRIMRKYLRESSDIMQGDLAVPVALVGKEELDDSETFKEMSKIELTKKQSGGVMHPAPAPPPRRRMRPPSSSNWLLDADDPMSEDSDSEEDSEENKKTENDWSTWGREREQDSPNNPYGRTQRDSLFGQRQEEDSSTESTSRYGSSRNERSDSRGSRSFFSKRDSEESRRREANSEAGGYSGKVDRKQVKPVITIPSKVSFSTDRTANPTPNKSISQPPVFRGSKSSTDHLLGTGSKKSSGYTPYKSPYGAPRKPSQQSWGGQKQPKQEYRKVNYYQEWKKKNPGRSDPAGDDAFVNEFMKR